MEHPLSILLFHSKNCKDLVSSQQNTSEHLQAVELTALLKDNYLIMKTGLLIVVVLLYNFKK
jgi:hypothetical protein